MDIEKQHTEQSLKQAIDVLKINARDYLTKLIEENKLAGNEIEGSELIMEALEHTIVNSNIIKLEDAPKRGRGRPWKPGSIPKPPKEDKEVDPKFFRLRKIRTNPTLIRMTNVSTGEVTEYKSQYAASKALNHGCGFFTRNNGKVVNGMLVEIM
jgi:hypothetical protein